MRAGRPIANKTHRKQLRRFWLSLSNVSRGLLISVFGVIVNYLLLNYKSQNVLDAYVYCISLVNLGLVFTNWGGRDYSIKTLARHPAVINPTVSSLLGSRLILMVIPATVLVFAPLDGTFKLFTGLFLVLKTFNAVLEALVVVQKKYISFLYMDVFLYLFLTGALLLDHNTTNPAIFLMELLLIEFLRSVLSFLLFKKSMAFTFRLNSGWQLILASRTFFYIAITGFICSRVDLYMVGILLNTHAMSLYFMLVNLVALSQVAYSAFISTFSSNIFRYSAGAFGKFSVYSDKLGFLFALCAGTCIYFISNYYYHLALDVAFLFLIFANIFCFTLVLTQMYRYTRLNGQKMMVMVLLLSGVVNIVLSLVLTPVLGIKGAFIANTACLLCTVLLFRIIFLYGKR